jgi:hypothetical protein
MSPSRSYCARSTASSAGLRGLYSCVNIMALIPAQARMEICLRLGVDRIWKHIG